MIYYYKQIKQTTGETVGFVSYNDFQPSNNNSEIELVEISAEDFAAAVQRSIEDEGTEAE